MRALPCVILVLALVSTPAAFAGKGAFLRVYNLTDTPLELKTEVDGFDEQGARARALSGRIPPRSAFPANGALYVEENNFISASHLKFSFASPRGNPFIALRYRSSFDIFSQRHDDELYVYGSLYGFSGSGSQWVLNVFVCEQNFTPASWMSQIRDDVDLFDLLIPGTHDTATFPSVLPFVATQITNIRGQLDAGIRYFDLRGGFETGSFVESPTNILVYHGPVGLLGVWFTDILDATVGFLRKHPEEVVLLQVGIDHGDERKAEPIMKFLTRRYGDYFFTENRIPTLGEARGRIVLLNRYSSNSDTIGFRIKPWIGVRQPARYMIQDDYDTVMADKEQAVRDFFLQQCRPSSGGTDRLNLNFVSFAAKGLGHTPIQGALGWNGGESRIDGMNLRVSRFLNGLASVPNFQAVVPIDAVLDENDPTDGFVSQMLSYNFRRFGREGASPRNGRSFMLRAKVDPESLMTVTPGATPQLAASRRLPLEDSARQIFALQEVEGNLYRLVTTDSAGRSACLRATAGSTQVSTAPVAPSDPSQLWRVDRWRASSYFALVSNVDGRVLSLGRNNRIELMADGNREARLWMFDKVE